MKVKTLLIALLFVTSTVACLAEEPFFNKSIEAALTQIIPEALNSIGCQRPSGAVIAVIMSTISLLKKKEVITGKTLQAFIMRKIKLIIYYQEVCTDGSGELSLETVFILSTEGQGVQFIDIEKANSIRTLIEADEIQSE